MDIFVIPALLIVSIVFFLLSISHFRLARTIEDIPTSKIRSAHQGYVEIKGKTTLNGQSPLYVPRVEVPCVWYRYQVFRDDQGEPGDEERDKESIRGIFLEDATGICSAHAHRAEIYPTNVVQHYESNAIHRMSWIGVGEFVYVLGWLNTLHPAPRVDDVIAKETPEKGELRYGQLKEPLGTITTHPNKRYPFIIKSGYEHRVTLELRQKSVFWLVVSIFTAVFGLAMIVIGAFDPTY
jgi:hypothetical protein